MPPPADSWRRCADADADTAIAGCTALIDAPAKASENLAAAHFNRAIAWRHKKALDRAIEDYGRVLQLKPEDAEAYNNRGVALHAKGQIDRAIQDYGTALRLRPDYAEAYYNRGRALHDKSLNSLALADDEETADRAQSPYDCAIADYDQAIRLRPGYAEAYNNRGIAYYDTGDYARAIADYDHALRLRSDLAEAFNNRSLAWYKLGQYERAKQDFDITIKLRQHYGNALINRQLGASEAGPRRPDRA